MPVIAPQRLIDNRVQAIRKYHEDVGLHRAELDVSGGIDSAVMAGLLVLALGAENCTFAHLAINTNPEQTARAKRLIEGLGARLAVADFSYIYEEIVGKIINSLAEAEPVGPGYGGPGQCLPGLRLRDEIMARLDADPTILGSIRSTLRAPLGRAYNRITGGGIRHGTGNECEDRFIRFFQKGGDGEVDTNPIAMLSKAEVYQLAFALAQEFPDARDAYYEIIGAVPSADLWANGDEHNDESEISKWTGAPFTYGKLDVRTGKVVKIGTIERVSRFLDQRVYPTIIGGTTWGDVLFNDNTSKDKLDTLISTAAHEGPLRGLPSETVEKLLLGARKAERQTRHKMNPNIPTLGTRQDLLEAGILSNDFADYEIPESL